MAFIENVVPHYRLGYFRELAKCREFEFTVYCQDSDQVLNLNLVHDELPVPVRIVRYLQFRRVIRWQFLPICDLLAKLRCIYIFMQNPRYLSNLFWASIFRLAGKRVVLRNQVQTAGSDGLGKRLRLAWWKMFDAFLVYSDTEAEWLSLQGFPKARVVGWNNGLDQSKFDENKEHWTNERLLAWRERNGLQNHRLILSLARLTKKNNFDLGIQAMRELAIQHADLVLGP